MRYVDGYVLPVPRKNLPAYGRIARKAGKIWREHGALEVRECAGDDLDVKGMVPFPRRIFEGLDGCLRELQRKERGNGRFPLISSCRA